MPTAYNFIWLNNISKTRQCELQHLQCLPAANGHSVTTASEQRAAEQGLLLPSQGHGLKLIPFSPVLHSGFVSGFLVQVFRILVQMFIQILPP